MHVLLCAFGAAALSLFATSAFAQTKWDMATPYADGNFHTKNIAQFAQDVDKATNGGLKITIHSAGSLIKHPEIKKSVRQGVTPVGEVLMSLHANESPIYGLDSVPFLATSYADAKKLYAAQKPALEKKLADEGLVFLYSVPWPPQGIYSNKPLKSIDDLQGLKFRTYNAATSRIAALAKAVPVQIEAPDIPTAFSTGRVEAMVTSPSTGVDSKAWDFLKLYYDTQAWLPRNAVFVNKAAFDKLSADQRKAVMDAAKAAEERGWKASEAETLEKTKVLMDNKVAVEKPSDALRGGLAALGKTMADEWQASAGADGKAILDPSPRSAGGGRHPPPTPLRSGPMRRLLDGLYAVALTLSAACLVVIASLVGVQLIARFIDGALKLVGLKPTNFVILSLAEIAGYLLAAASFLALAPTLKAGAHIRVTMALSAFAERTRPRVELAAFAVATIICAYMTWSIATLAYESFRFNEMSTGIVPVRLGWPQAAMAAGLVVLTIAFVDELIIIARRGRPSFRAAEDAITLGKEG